MQSLPTLAACNSLQTDVATVHHQGKQVVALTTTSRGTQRPSPYHAHRVPVIGLQPIVIPCGNTPQGGVSLQQHCCCLKEVQEVWAEEHVILHNDNVTVALLQEHSIQRPLVMLG